jgi:PAS domain S-box-containing protein
MASDPLISSAAGIALVGACGDEHGRILRANHQLAELLATTVEAVIGTRLCEHVHPDDQAQAHNAYRRLMADRRTLYEGNARLVAANGDLVPVQAFASLITVNAGTAVVFRVLPQ